MPVTRTTDEVVETAKTVEVVETVGVSEDGEKSKGGKYLENLA